MAAQCSYWGGFLEPVVGDLDGDGSKEVVVYKAGEPPEVRAYRTDGSLLWSLPLGTAGVAGGNLPLPLITDLDNDGHNEVVVYDPEFVAPYTAAKLYAIRFDGSIAPGWPITLPLDFHPSLAAADLDGNGKSEIIFKGNDSAPRQMFIINGQGGIVSQWNLEPKSWGGLIESTPAVANLDADPELEIVVADPAQSAGLDFNTGQWNNTGVIYVYNRDGSIVPGWPVYTDGVIFASPAIGDIDDNGQNDIVVGLDYASNYYPDNHYGGLYAFGPAGNLLPGWPFGKGYDFFSSPSLGDLDGNGDLEIAASQLEFATYVFNHNGVLAFGWPQYTAGADIYSTVMADASGDGQPDVLTTAGGGKFGGGVYAWNLNGSSVTGFPKTTEEDAEAPVTLSDIDADGQVELAASSDFDYDEESQQYKLRGSVYLWDLPVIYNPASAHWNQFHHDLRRSGRYCRPTATGGDNPPTCNPALLGYYHPLPPYRVLDTRYGPYGSPAGKMPPNGVVTVDVTGGASGVPGADVSAVVLNATVTEPTAAGFLTIYPSRAQRPVASNLNFGLGQTVPNLVTVKVGLDGNIKVYNSSGLTHVIFDVVGWYGSATAGSRFNAVSPFRILDTRSSPQGAPAGKVGAQSNITVDVTGMAGSGVPASGVSAVVVNATVTEPTEASYLTVYPSDAQRPLASNLNFAVGQTVPNLVTVKVGADGNVKVFNAAGQTHVIFDVVGWYGSTSGDLFHPLTPNRILDTRTGPQPIPPGKVGSNAEVTIDVTGAGTVPITGPTSLVVNTTVTAPTAPSYLTVYPSGITRPLASNLNFAAGQTVPNLVIVKVGLDGNVKAYNNNGQTQIIFDAVGYFSP